MCYSKVLLLKYVLYGMFSSWVVFRVVFHGLSESGQTLSDGKDIGFHAAGNIVYGACVLVANLMLFHHISTHSIWSTALFLLSNAAYFGVFYVESKFAHFHEVYGIFNACFEQKGVWAGLLFVLIFTSACEMMYNAIT